MRIEQIGVGSAVTEHEVALGARRPNPRAALVVGAVTVLVLGGGLAVGVGRGDDSDGQGTRLVPTTTVAPSSTEPSTPTTRSTVPRTTTPSPVPTYTGEPIPELAGEALYTIVNTRVVRIDSTTGEAVVLAGGERVALSPEETTQVPRTGGVVVTGGSPRFVPDDGSPVVPLGLSQGWVEVWPAADPALVWVVEYVTDPPTPRLVRAATGETVATVQVPRLSYPVGDDGTGRLLVVAETGGTFALNPATGAVERFSDAKIIAVTPTHLLQLRCDDALVCSYEIADRASGGATTVPIEPDLSPVGPLDPTGSRVVLSTNSGPAPALWVLDLNTGAQTELGFTQTAGGEGAVSWTEDGSHLVTPQRGTIAVWSAATREVAEYRLSTGDREAIVTNVVPSSPSLQVPSPRCCQFG